MDKFRVEATQTMTIWEDTVEANSKEEAISKAHSINYKDGLMMKYMDNLEANSISFNAEEEE
tara:strand:+ start:203 stop:388 length:186 start_codon:yes stop_codon:yes gene_type:complete